jgi:hypothetical protein
VKVYKSSGGLLSNGKTPEVQNCITYKHRKRRQPALSSPGGRHRGPLGREETVSAQRAFFPRTTYLLQRKRNSKNYEINAELLILTISTVIKLI